jgi:uncharacterized protein YoxC
MNDKVVNIDKPDDKKSGDIVIEGDAMDRFARTFEASARRWELVVYPAMLAFVVLAAYGFFLIYTLSKDISILAQGMDPEMGKHLSDISDSVIILSENVRTMTRRVYKMSDTLVDISGKMDTLDNLDPMLVNMRGLNTSVADLSTSVRGITFTSDAMRQEMNRMGHSMRPLNFMGDFMPW